MPIRPDYVGRNIPTSLNEKIEVHVTEIDGADEVAIINNDAKTDSPRKENNVAGK
jgi:pyrimidine operon attenuation protein/uracil phosphoribosyltransferase